MSPMIELSDDVPAYRAVPEGEVRGGLVLIHEIWGLQEHTTDVADRFAELGYLVIAPDLLSGVGITPEVGEELQGLMFADDATRSARQPELRERLAPTRAPEFAGGAVATLRAAVDDLESADGVEGRIGVVGFCFGGSYAFALAAADRRIRAAVPFYGSPPEGTAVGEIACPVLALYGEEDPPLMEGLPGLRREADAAGVDLTTQVYPGAGHAFFNDTNPVTFHEEAARDAWRRTLDFLASALA